jgi:hypothetical protein
MKKNKKIFFEYVQINSVPYENNKVRISKNFPKYDKYKELFLYELFYHDFLEEKIKNTLCRNFNDYQFYDSFLIELTNGQFDEIKYLFDKESDLEKEKWENDYSMINLAISALKCDPKFWEV